MRIVLASLPVGAEMRVYWHADTRHISLKLRDGSSQVVKFDDEGA
jgi:hypothetical protein